MKANWIDTLIGIRRAGFNHDVFFSINVRPIAGQQHHPKWSLESPALGRMILHPKYNSSDKFPKLLQWIIKTAIEHGVNEQDAIRQINELSKFREKLRVPVRSPTDVKFEQLQRSSRNIDWNRVADNIIGQTKFGEFNQIQADLNYLTILDNALEKASNE